MLMLKYPSQEDRFLVRRRSVFYYKRRVPLEISHLDHRAPHVRVSLKTFDLAEARAKRDMYEDADNRYWSSLLGGDDETRARNRYDAAKRRADALGFTYKSAHEIALDPLHVIVDRLEALFVHHARNDNRLVLESGLGTVEKPIVTIRQAKKIYLDEITPPRIAGKSPAQKERWIKGQVASFNLMISVIGNKEIDSIEREDALKLYRALMQKVAPQQGEATHSASFGRRQIGNIRKFYRDYYRHIGDRDRTNPFEGLTFRDLAKKTRPPFPVEWIQQKILVPGVLSGLNEEARAIVLVAIETGARLGEICNLTAEHTHLDIPFPYIEIAPILDKERRREIKTGSSIRKIPLIGVALVALKKYPNGFARYQDRETALSNLLIKYFRNHGLFPMEKHKIYSFRHSFEDRMKEAGLDHELRMSLMGHAIERPQYGTGGSMEWQWRELKKIELPFNPGIV